MKKPPPPAMAVRTALATLAWTAILLDVTYRVVSVLTYRIWGASPVLEDA